MKLLSKYVRVNILLVVVVLLISCIFLKILINKVLIHELDEELADVRTTILKYVKEAHVIPASSILYNYQFQSKMVTDTLESWHYKTNTRYIPEKQGTRNFRELVFFVKVSDSWYRITVEKQIEGVKIMGRILISLSLLTMLFVIALQFFINKMVLRSLWNPFYQTLAIMRSFQLNKENNLQFPETNIEEFAYMNEILKHTTQKAGQDYIALKEFTENASHELQTPLAIISSKLDLLIQDQHMSKRQNQTIIGAYTALNRMAHLNQSLLLLAKIGNEQFSDVDKVALHEKILEKTDLFRELWQDQNLTIKESISESFIRINSDLCDILINNLFSNATNHNIQGGFIRIILAQGSFTIGNSGPDLQLDPQKIFRRFYKSDQSSESNGLGLSIIKNICDVSDITMHYTFENSEHIFVLTWRI